MDRLSFVEQVRSEGYDAPVEISREADGFMDTHEHPFDAWVLIERGEIELIWKGQSVTYHAGECFRLDRNEPHQERYGPQGVTYLAARRSR